MSFLAKTTMQIPPTALDVFEPPAGLALQGGGHLYGAMPGANWILSQWSTPEMLPPFVNGCAANASASVAFNADGSISLAQDGAKMPADETYGSGLVAPQEFDAFLSPAKWLMPVPPLSGLGNIFMGETISAAVAGPYNSACKINAAAFMVAVILNNAVSNQTLFYQLSLPVYGLKGEPAPAAPPQPDWFFTGTNLQSGAPGQWGYDDRAWTSFGLPPLPPRTPVSYCFDVLPRLQAVIAQGATLYKLDGDLNNWQIGSTYRGDAIWGHVWAGSKRANMIFRVVIL